MGEGRTSEPGGEPQANYRLTVAQAATRLGITQGAVRSRIKRGTLPTVKEAGTVYVLLGGTSEANQETSTAKPYDVPGDQTELVESLRDQVAFLRAELERRGEEADRYQRIVAGLAQTNANLSERVRELEPPETPGGPETAAEGTERVEDPADPGGAQEATERRSWWRRWLGGE